MPFRLLDHTADVQAECRGATFGEVLEAAAEALYAVALSERRRACAQHESIAVEAADRPELLIGWLQELIFLLEVEHFVAVDCAFETLTETMVKASVSGYACSAEERMAEVKSATYHELELKETPEGLLARVIFDL